jgi:ribosome-binding factor A
VRDRKVAELLRSEIADILLREVKDPKVKDVVITSIDISKDLSIAKVYFSTYNRTAKEGIEKGLNRSAGFIKHCIIKGLRLKKVPNLRFIYDESGDYGQKIDDLLKGIDTSGQE